MTLYLTGRLRVALVFFALATAHVRPAVAQFATTEVSGTGSGAPLRITKTGWTWEDLAGVTYSVYRSTASDGGFECILDGHPTASWAGDPTALAPNRIFHYVITGFDGTTDNSPGSWSTGTERTLAVPCPRACCMPDGSCVDESAADCVAAGGSSRGAGSACSSTTCPPPVIDCIAECGDDSAGARIFLGANTVPAMTVELLATDDHVVRITIPRDPRCQGRFTLFGLEFRLQNIAGGGIAPFLRGQITDGVGGGPFVLPDITDGIFADEYEDGNANEADTDGSDGVMILRWYQVFCSSTGSCAYPLVRAGTDPLVVDLTFEAPACDVTLTEFNFRVPVDLGGDGVPEELLCTSRGATDPQPAELSRRGGVTNAPGGTGTGRGPVSDPTDPCATCTEDCPPCMCPINSDDSDIAMDYIPTVTLGTDPVYGANARLSLGFTQNAPCTLGCDAELVDLRMAIRPQPTRDCDPRTCSPRMPALMSGAALIHGDGSIDPIPIAAETYNACCDIFVRWTMPELAGIAVHPGEDFELQFTFDADLAGSEIYDLELEFGRPIAFECGPTGDGPVECDTPLGGGIPID